MTDREVLASRPAKNRVDPYRPNGFFAETERQPSGAIESVATVLLTNRECPFRCLMCDLWKNTTDAQVPDGAIPHQIDYALSRLPPCRHLKLYNAGNFFDRKAIPKGDFGGIANALKGFKTVIVENHPKLCQNACLELRDLLDGDLEIAMGLETIHPEILPKLNKRMTLEDFDSSTQFLLRNGIRVRTFILATLPFLSEAEGVEWAVRSVDHAFGCGVGCASIIPTRAGNGIMDKLLDLGAFAPPDLTSIERVLETSLQHGGGRVFLDLWDIEQFATCPHCVSKRVQRLETMNLEQRFLPRVECDQCGGGTG